MQEVSGKHGGWVGYKEYDLVSVPVDIPTLGVKQGETGLVRYLDLRMPGDVIATVQMFSAAGQTKGWLEMEVRPAQRVLSYAPAG